MRKTGKKKNFVLDTNILLHDKNAIFGFDDNNVYITGTTLQELDGKKSFSGEIGYIARETCRILDELRGQGDLLSGVDLSINGQKTGGKLVIEPDGVSEAYLLPGYSLNVADNRIISTCKYLESRKKEPFILVTNDISMRINATVMGISVEGYRNDHISDDKLYTGRRILHMSKDGLKTLKEDGEMLCEKVTDIDSHLADGEDEFFMENEFLQIFPEKANSEESPLLGIWQKGKIKRINPGIKVNSVCARNAAQDFALYALTAPVDEIPLVFLIGAAGTSKTFLSLAAGLDGVNDFRYDKILISRNNVTSDEAFGYLPGTLEEKMMPLLAPFYDNLETIIRGDGEDREQVQIQIDDYFDTGMIQVAPMAYMRGRSITKSYVILDEAQNATRSQIRDVITRAGQDTKIVICGDINQIDAPTLDRWNNGLTYASTMMKNSPLAATLFFENAECQRSTLASAAIELLKEGK
ncbi:MAG: PhoH family protein [Lachnospiraceae bacterium]|nr:PhoH family protein [Lachnospiraceae bacterium]